MTAAQDISFCLVLRPQETEDHPELPARIQTLTKRNPNVKSAPIKGNKTLSVAWEVLTNYFAASQLSEADFVLSEMEDGETEDGALLDLWEHSGEEAKRTLAETFTLLSNTSEIYL